MQANAKLEGIFTPHMVPLDQAGNVCEEQLHIYINWLIEKGVHGLYPNGSTGEFTRFTVEERRRIVKVVCEAAAGRVPVLAGAAEANIKETLAACEAYAEYGARAVAIVAPYYYKLSDESVYAYFREIALNSPIDVTLYNIPMFASPIEVPILQRLAELPRIIGIKDSTGDVAHMMRMIQAVKPNRPDFTFMTGWDVVLVPMMLVGANGGTNASSGVTPEVTRKLYDLYQAGDIDGAMEVQYALINWFDTMLYSADFPEGFRAALELRGFDFGPSRQPMSTPQQEARGKLQEELADLLARFGFAPGNPSDASSACNPQANAQLIEQIAEQVKKALAARGY